MFRIHFRSKMRLEVRVEATTAWYVVQVVLLVAYYLNDTNHLLA